MLTGAERLRMEPARADSYTHKISLDSSTSSVSSIDVSKHIVPEHVSASTMTPSERRIATFIFTLMGTSALYYWNSVLNTLYTVAASKFGYTMPNNVTAYYSTAACLTAFLISFLGAARPCFFYAGGAVLLLMSIAFPLVLTQSSGKTGETLLYVIAVVAGISEMFFQISGYAMSVILPEAFGSWVSFGYGICGVLTFSFWMLFSQGVWKVDDIHSEHVNKCLWCHFAFGALVVGLAIGGFYFLCTKNFMKQALQNLNDPADDATRASDDIVHDEEIGGVAFANSKKDPSSAENLYDPAARQMNMWQVFRKTWLTQISFAFLIGMSMMCFPNIGPYGWRRSIKENDILTGMFQIGDFTGRYIPNLALVISWTWTRFSNWILLPLTYLRVALLILFILVAKNAADNFAGQLMSDYGLQIALMLALALTHGWYAGIYMARIPEPLPNPADKAKASALAVCLLVASISIGMWLAKFVKFGDDPAW